MSAILDLRLGDCMEGMKEFPDYYFDLAVVDPPYGIGESSNNNKSRSKLGKSKDYGSKNWDDSYPEVEYFNELKRVSSNQIIWGANHFIKNINNPNSSCWIIWDKQNGSNDFADCELAYGSFTTAARKFTYRWHGMLQGDMKNKENRIHPTQKPVALYKWLLKNYAKEGDKILDTHLGSMSSVVACWDMGFDITGFEIDEDYYKAGIERVENHKKQISAFDPRPEASQVIQLKIT